MIIETVQRWTLGREYRRLAGEQSIVDIADRCALPLLQGCAQVAPLSHAQPGGLWQVSCRLMQVLPQALPWLQVRQQVRGSSVGLAGSAGLAGLAGSGRGGSLRAGFSGFCCAIASPAGVAASISTTNITYLILLTISGRYPRRAVGGSDFNARVRGQGRYSPRRLADRRVSLPLFGGERS